MSIVSPDDIALFQADAESMMYDTCTITRASQSPTSSAAVTVYSGPCQFKVEARPRPPANEPTGTQVDRDRVVVKIPISATGVEFNDKVTCASSINPSLVGEKFFVIGLFGQSAGSAQRLSCERILR